MRSQKHEGWTILDDRYDDGGFSGGTMARPALTRLLEDIRRKHVDVVVVYKVDRLSRSLLDFAKLMETFDKHGVSFVSVTQQFNTASSMGRLILNVLLSFAQFEREMIAERTKDKMGAARRKGKWVGGRPALGYDVVDGRLAVNADEAEQVRALFRLYLQERSFRRVAGILNARGWRLKSWRNKEGKWVQGGEWDASAVHRHITNVVYIGKVDYEGAIYDGERQPIVDAGTFEQAARIGADGRIDRGAEARNTTGYLLRGLIRCMVCNSIMTTATSVARPHLPLLLLHQGHEARERRLVVTERLADIETRSAQMEARLAEIAAGWTTNEKLLVGAERVEKILSSFMAVWEVFSTKERARMLHVLFDKIEFNGEKEVKARPRGAGCCGGSPRSRMTDSKFVRLHFHVTRKGHRRIIREGSRPEPVAARGRIPRIARLIALAHKFEGMLRDGAIGSMADIARVGHVTRARVTQIMDLLLLAPDIQEELLHLPPVTRGDDPITLRELRYVMQTPDWADQRSRWSELFDGTPELKA